MEIMSKLNKGQLIKVIEFAVSTLLFAFWIYVVMYKGYEFLMKEVGASAIHGFMDLIEEVMQEFVEGWNRGDLRMVVSMTSFTFALFTPFISVAGGLYFLIKGSIDAAICLMCRMVLVLGGLVCVAYSPWMFIALILMSLVLWHRYLKEREDENV